MNQISETIGKLVKYLQLDLAKSSGLKQAGDEVSEAIWEWIRPIFLKDEEPIANLKSNPEAKKNIALVITQIEKHIEQNPSEKKKIATLLGMIKDHKVQSKKNGMKVTGNSNISIQDNDDGAINISINEKL